jgi:hypothetical protein
VRTAIQSLPWRERKVIGLYYYGEVTMKQIGAEIGVNESRVSQLHARAIRRLRDALGDMNPQKVAEMRRQLLAFALHKPVMAKVEMPKAAAAIAADKPAHAVVLAYKPATRRAPPAKTTLRPVARRQAVAAAR